MEHINNFNNLITIMSFILNITFVIPILIRIHIYFTQKIYIKKVLGYSKGNVQISHCIFPLETYSHSQNNFIAYSSLVAMNNIVELFNIIQQKFYLIENPIDVKNEMNIGGFSANKKVSAYFTKYFPHFKYIENINKKEAYSKHPTDKHIYEFSFENKRGFKIDEELFLDTTEKICDYAFLIKLVKADFKNDYEKTVHILFGGSDIGTIKATEYLLTHCKQIYEAFGEKHYFFALEINRVDNSINYQKGIIDLTDRMFKENL